MVFFRKEQSFRDAWPLYEAEKRLIEILDRNWIEEEEKKKTAESYNSRSSFYNSVYENSVEMSRKTAANYLLHFFKCALKVSDNPKALVLGSGNGRDCIKLLLAGIKVHAVDYSHEMMSNILWYFDEESTETNSNIDKSFQATVSDIEGLSVDFANEEFDSVLGDSFLQHLNHPSVYAFFDKAYHWLKPGGAILFRLKHTDHGLAYVIHDGVGTRYYTSWTLEDISELKKYLQARGYEIGTQPGDEIITPHRDTASGTPPFYQLVIRKSMRPTTTAA